MRLRLCRVSLLFALPIFGLSSKAIPQTPASARAAESEPATILDRDKQFERGSGVRVSALTPLVVDDLVMLGRVWGFLKYHHPVVTAGGRQWDYELLRVLPQVLGAKSRAEAEGALVRWIDALGAVPPCTSCARLDERELVLRPETGWIDDAGSIGEPLRSRLRKIDDARPTGAQFYVSLNAHVLNPSFDHELSYSAVAFPDAGFQLLALYRFWNIYQYWSPNREVAGEDWPGVLREAIPQVMLARSKEAYELAMLRLVAKANDTHTNLWSSLGVRPPAHSCGLVPVNVRFVEGKPVVASYASTKEGAGSGLKVGDVIETVGGVPVEETMRDWTPFYADSNEATRLRDIGRSLMGGACGAVEVKVLRDGVATTVASSRLPTGSLDAIAWTHDLPGPTFRMLSSDVAYLKLSSIKAADVSRDLALAATGTKGLIVDIRNYPSEFVVFALGSLLMERTTPFARFTSADLANPGAFHWGHTEVLEPVQPRYAGKVVVLVDETSLSQAEYTAMALQATGAVVVGSMTAGADGNVSAIPLPGELRTMISGIGVFYPDKRPTQRVGVRVDVEARPTIAGIRAGRDEVLERGVREIVGQGVIESEIERMTRP